MTVYVRVQITLALEGASWLVGKNWQITKLGRYNNVSHPSEYLNVQSGIWGNIYKT